mgnify:CR=1 FL=1
MSPPGVESAPGEKDPDKIRAFIARRARRRRRRRHAESCEHAHDRPAAQFLPHRPRRARAFRPLRRPLRRRDADAADPRAGAGLRRRPRPIRRSSARWTAICKHYVGRPSPLYFAERTDRSISAARKIYFKREDLNHTGAHKVNNVLGQIMLAQPHGQAAHHRRDRRRPCTASRPRRCARKFGLRMRRLHGRGRRRAAAAQRVAHEAARRRGAPGRVRLADAQGRDERGAARLGRPTSPTRSTASARSPARIPIR